MHDAVLNACDALDGAKDGVLENPLACKFDPGVLACKDGGDAASCLTRRRSRGSDGSTPARRIRERASTSSRASSAAASWVGSPVPVGYAVDYFKYIVFKDPQLGSEDAELRLRRRAREQAAANLVFDANDTRSQSRSPDAAANCSCIRAGPSPASRPATW